MSQLPTIHATLPSTDWRPITLSTGWAAAPNHTPMWKKSGDLVIVMGAVERKYGASMGKIGTITGNECWPSRSQLVGASVTNNGSYAEIYVESDGNISVNGYNTFGDKTGMLVPLSCIYVPRKD